MPERRTTVESILNALQDRTRGLKCLYAIERLLANVRVPLEQTLRGVVEAIPPAMQFPDFCQVRITHEHLSARSPNFVEAPWAIATDITIQGEALGRLEVFYTNQMPEADDGPFLSSEKTLIQTIADRLGHFILHKRLMENMREWDSAEQRLAAQTARDWAIILDLLRRTDQALLLRIARKMINQLCWSGVREAERLLDDYGAFAHAEEADLLIDANRPRDKAREPSVDTLVDEVFRIAATHMSDEDIVACVHKWMKQDRASFLVNALENYHTSHAEVADAIARYQHATRGEADLSLSTRKGLRVSLVRRFLTDQLEFIDIAKNYVEIKDFHELLQRTIFPSKGYGKIGGKSAGLFLANQVIKQYRHTNQLLEEVRIPKTWYITSDGLHNFVYCNHLEDVFTQKYKDIEEVRREYPHIVAVFKHSMFSSDMIKGLSMALDDLGERPVIVRSSSLLEDRIGAAFSGKYKSLFLANQGTKAQRLAALTDAIAEVYASTFSPDPIEYRAGRNLLDFQEGMGVLIQEVIGMQVGDYLLPPYAGVAFSLNEFRWSPRIRRDDGLVRLVPGLGTRAVDRLGDDYPILAAPGQPNLRANVSAEEMMRYSPHYMDVISLKRNRFETVRVRDFLRECGDCWPGVEDIISVADYKRLRRPLLGQVDFERDDPVVTFDGLLSRTPLLARVESVLRLLQDKLQTPVDIEFASDGEKLVLVQCRTQNPGVDGLPAEIPRDVPHERVVFTAGRHVSNGSVENITHVVYVDPEKYAQAESLDALNAVGRAVGRLNAILPRRRFILMGPGRWGSRGNIKLGVKVTYSDISNTAMLIEIARRKGDYTPDVSFGTHFFQDLVEASIRYLPLYPDDEGILFNEAFFCSTENELSSLLPDYAGLSDIIRVIHVPQVADGRLLHVLTNAETDEALAFLGPASEGSMRSGGYGNGLASDGRKSVAARDWRERLARKLSLQLDVGRFGIVACYLLDPSAERGTDAQPPIEILIHVQGDERQRRDLETWVHGWCVCLSELSDDLANVDAAHEVIVHLVDDEELACGDGAARRFLQARRPPRPLPLRRSGARSAGSEGCRGRWRS